MRERETESQNSPSHIDTGREGHRRRSPKDKEGINKPRPVAAVYSSLAGTVSCRTQIQVVMPSLGMSGARPVRRLPRKPWRRNQRKLQRIKLRLGAGLRYDQVRPVSKSFGYRIVPLVVPLLMRWCFWSGTMSRWTPLDHGSFNADGAVDGAVDGWWIRLIEYKYVEILDWLVDLVASIKKEVDRSGRVNNSSMSSDNAHSPHGWR